LSLILLLKGVKTAMINVSMSKVITSCFFLFLLFLSLGAPSPASAAVAKSNCVVLNIGNASSIPLPPECQTNMALPNLQCIRASNGEYCKLPPSPKAPNGTPYYVSATWTKWGSKEMIQMLFTVAQKWKNIYPQGFLVINDIAAPLCDRGCHLSHYGGTAVDIIATNGTDRVADNQGDSRRWRDAPGSMPKRYNPTATVQFGKLFHETGLVNYIIYYDTTANSAISSLKKLGLTMLSTSQYSDHRNHFHVHLKRPYVNPACSVAISSNCR
jgi:hypothetical protein